MTAHVEYDLGKAASERELKRVTLIDFDGNPTEDFAWEKRFVAFKVLKWKNVAYRFLYVFERIVYYQRSDILDLDVEHGSPYEFAPSDPYKLKARLDTLGETLARINDRNGIGIILK